jgi:TRAP-type C4-dicarboxylate transport system permease small subunit
VLDSLRGASDALNRVVIGVCIACLLVMLGISFTGFLYQLFTGAALSWTYSLARLFIPWIGMLSITVAFKTGEHVAMSVLLRFFPQPVVNVILWINVALIGVFALLLVWFGWSFFVNSTHYNMVSDQIQVHQRFVAACVPLTGVILLVHLVCGRALLDFSDPEAEAEALVREAGAAPAEASRPGASAD